MKSVQSLSAGFYLINIEFWKPFSVLTMCGTSFSCSDIISTVNWLLKIIWWRSIDARNLKDGEACLDQFSQFFVIVCISCLIFRSI